MEALTLGAKPQEVMGEVTSITYNQAHNLVEMHSTLFILNFRSEEQENKIERLEMQVEAQGVLLKEIGEGLCLVISSKATLQVIPVGHSFCHIYAQYFLCVFVYLFSGQVPYTL